MLKNRRFLFQKRLFLNFKKVTLLLLLLFCIPKSGYTQCTPPFDIPFSLAELDSTINYNFTSTVTGVDFVQPLYLNLPLCPEYAEEGAGCTQVELPIVDYDGLGLGYSGAFIQVFWRDIWENQVNASGELMSIDSDGDGCTYDDVDDPFALTEYGISEESDNNNYDDGWTVDWDNNGSMDFAVVIIYYCDDDPNTLVNEAENICSCNTEFFSINESNDFDLTSSQTNVSCYQSDDASITTSSTGGQGPFLYNWSFIEDSFTVDGDLIDEGSFVENLTPGEYSLIVEDTGIPCTYSYDFLVTEPDSFAVTSVLATDPSCFGLSDGTAELVISGGTPPYSQEQLTGLGDGNYELIISDANGCEAFTSFNLTAPPQIEIDFEVSSFNGFGVSCFSYTDGFISILSIEGGSGTGYTYSWSTGDTTSVISDLNADLYTLVITDSEGCQETFEFDITEPDEMTITETHSDYNGYGVSCNGSNNGLINITVTGGTGEYTYEWSNGSSEEDLVDIGAGIFSVVVTDENGCSVFIEVELLEPDEMSIIETHSDYNGYGVSCNGASNGEINTVVSGGVGVYAYQWSNGSTNSDLFGIEAGTYSLIVTDQNGCTVSVEVVITEPDLLDVTLDSSSILNLTCGQDTTAQIDVSVSGGIEPYIYTWNNGDTIEDIINVGVGSYILSVVDLNGCVDTLSVDVVAPEGLFVSEPIISYCNDFDNPDTEEIECGAELFIENITGGSPGYEILIVDEEGSVLLTDSLIVDSYFDVNICNGDYSLTITDQNDCFVNYSYSIVYGEIQTPSTQIFNNGILVEDGDLGFCTGEVASISVTTTGGADPYSYSWVDNSSGDTILVNSPVISIGSPGEFSVITTNSVGCVTEDLFSVSELEDLNINTGLDAECPGQDSYLYIIGEPSGGEAPYYYEWFFDNNGDGLDTDDDVLIDAGPDVNFVAVSSFGDYYLMVSDVNGCDVTQLLTLNWSLDIGLDLESIIPPCFSECDGQVTFVPDSSLNPFSFSDWELYYSVADIDGDGVNNLDENGNILDDDIDGDGVLNGDDDDIDGDGVLNDDDNLTSLSPYSIFLQSFDFTIDSLCTGEYYLLGLSTNGDGCETLLEFFDIIEYEDLVIDSIDVTDISCFGNNDGSVTINVTGGSLVNQTYDLFLNDDFLQSGSVSSSIIISDLSVGDYTFFVSDSECENIQNTFSISEPTEIVVNIESVLSELPCFGDTIGFLDISVSGGVPPYTYLWSNNETTADIFDLSAGTYTLTVTDSTGCGTTFLQEIIEPDVFSISYEVSDISCYGEDDGFIDITTSGTGPFSYNWSNGSFDEDLVDLSPGIYVLDVFSDSDCGQETLEFEILEPDEIEIVIDDVQSSSCFSFSFNNGSIDISVTGGTGSFTYSWFSEGASFASSEEDISGLSAGFYDLTVTDSDGCQVQYPDQIQILEPSPIEFFDDLDNNGVINSSFDYSEYVCTDLCDGQLSIDLGGGVAPFTFELITLSGEFIQDNNSGIFNGLCADCYVVNIYDANWSNDTPDECVTTLNFCIDTSDPSIEAEIIPSGCTVTGSANFDFFGGVIPYDISVYLNNSLYLEELDYTLGSIVFDNLPSGSLEIFIEDSIGCNNSYIFELQNALNEIEIVDLSVMNPVCPMEMGVATIEFSNSFNPDSSGSFGTIYLAQDNNNDCFFDTEDILLQEINIENSGSSNILVDLTELEGGDYVILIEDNFGCSLSACFFIDNIVEPNPEDFFVSVDAVCNGASGSAYVSDDPLDVGGTPFLEPPYYLVNWFDEDGDEVNTVSPDALIASSLFAGNYTVIITDANDCVFEHDFVISEPNNPLISGISYFDSDCGGSCDGEIVIQPFGGEGDFYTIIITPLGSSSYPPQVLVPGINDTYILSNVCPGDYEIEVLDDVCPSVFENITILEPESIEWTIEIEPLPCNDDVVVWSESVLDGNYYVYTGGTGPVDLYWFTQGQSLTIGNEVDINNLGPGTYNLLSVDALGCETIHGPIIIDETPELNSDFNPFDSELWIYCPGDNTGVLAFNTYGGTPVDGPYTYLWSFNGEYLPQYDNMNVVSNLFEGEYEVTVDDENGCGPIIHNITIEEPSPISVDVIQSSYNDYGVSCFDSMNGFIDLIVEGGLNPDDSSFGYTYEWSGISPSGDIIDLTSQENNEDLLNVPAGIYNVLVQVDIPEDENLISSCEYYEEIEITEPLFFEILDNDITDVSCNGLSDGTIDVSINGGVPPYTFNWVALDGEGNSINLGSQSSNQNLIDLISGEYVVSVQDENGCGPIFDTIVVLEPEILTSNLLSSVISLTNANCSFGNTDSGGLTIHLDSLFSQISGGTEPYDNPYIIDSGGDIQSGIVVGDSIYFSNLEGGLYNILITDALDCDLSVSVTIEIDNQDLIDLGFITEDVTCGTNGSILINSISNLNGVPPYNIVISNLNNDLDYEFSIIDGFDYDSDDWNNNGVIDYDPDIDGDGYLNIFDGDIDGDGIENYLDSTIYGEEFEDVDNDGVLNFDSDFDGSDYGWYETVPSGEYEITVTDAAGCEGFVDYLLIEEVIPSFAVTTTAGNCYVELNNSCDSLSNNGTISINPNTLPIPTLYPYYLYLDGEIYDTIFDWGQQGNIFNEYVISNLEAGTAYSVSIIDGNGCSYSNSGDFYEVPFLSEFNVDIVGFCPECEESSNGGFAYTFLGINDEVLWGSNPDSYEIYSSPLNYFDNEDLNINILSSTIPVLDCLLDSNLLDTVAINEELLNDQDFYFVNDEWLSMIPEPNILENYHQNYLELLEDTTDYVVGGLSYGIYYITMIDQYGCQFVQEIDISSENCSSQFGSQQWDNCLFIPSVFTPNGDGINDLWDIYNIQLYEPGVKVTLFNRWGQIVYQNLDGQYSGDLWNGVNLKGESVEIATYYYVIELEGYNKNYTGYVVVKR